MVRHDASALVAAHVGIGELGAEAPHVRHHGAVPWLCSPRKQSTSVSVMLVRTEPRQLLLVQRHSSSPRCVSRNFRYLYELTMRQGTPRDVTAIFTGSMASLVCRTLSVAKAMRKTLCALKPSAHRFVCSGGFYFSPRFTTLPNALPLHSIFFTRYLCPLNFALRYHKVLQFIRAETDMHLFYLATNFEHRSQNLLNPFAIESRVGI